MDFYEQLKRVRDGYEYPPAVHHQHDDGEASEALQKAKFVLVRPRRTQAAVGGGVQGTLSSQDQKQPQLSVRGERRNGGPGSHQLSQAFSHSARGGGG